MQELVKTAIEAHGGLEQWKQVRQISASFSAAGLGFKQRGPIAEEFTCMQMRVMVETREQKSVVEPFIAAGQKGFYERNRTVVKALDGTIVEELENPRGSFNNMIPGTPWRATQVLYFVGYSLWMYCTLPYSFLEDGVSCEEVEPWVEAGERWRALKVTYPASYPSHSTEQIHYFDNKGLMRRQDYTVDIRQNIQTAHYMDGHRNFDGFVFPTRRRIYVRGPDGAPLRDKLLISADLDDFKLSRAAR